MDDHISTKRECGVSISIKSLSLCTYLYIYLTTDRWYENTTPGRGKGANSFRTLAKIGGLAQKSRKTGGKEGSCLWD